ncbi:MAG: hypothetical protein CL582_23405 [Alteromonadaceae bacterium]|nr:hypothetical protein [Alteromonadaceae bacterium]|tara:strand:- start:698 stop:1075 length:378 start_codon:yes stop_codon:yes gene_type:complete
MNHNNYVWSVEYNHKGKAFAILGVFLSADFQSALECYKEKINDFKETNTDRVRASRTAEAGDGLNTPEPEEIVHKCNTLDECYTSEDFRTDFGDKTFVRIVRRPLGNQNHPSSGDLLDLYKNNPY